MDLGTSKSLARWGVPKYVKAFAGLLLGLNPAALFQFYKPAVPMSVQKPFVSTLRFLSLGERRSLGQQAATGSAVLAPQMIGDPTNAALPDGSTGWNTVARELSVEFVNATGDSLMLPIEERRELNNLTDRQLQGIAHVRSQWKDAHAQALPALTTRATMLGFKRSHVSKALEWVRELAPIIIHVELSMFAGKLANDTHFRNHFETNAMGRRSKLAKTYWYDDQRKTAVQNRLFGDAYDGSHGFERIKYAVLNILNNSRGHLSCRSYGQDYLVLKRVRLRSTVTHGDSWKDHYKERDANPVGTLDLFAHILVRYTDEELSALLRLACGSKLPYDLQHLINRTPRTPGKPKKIKKKYTNLIKRYTEVQVHGELRLQDHVAQIFVHQKHREETGFAEKLHALQKACGNCEVVWMDEIEFTGRNREQIDNSSDLELPPEGEIPMSVDDNVVQGEDKQVHVKSPADREVDKILSQDIVRAKATLDGLMSATNRDEDQVRDAYRKWTRLRSYAS